MSTLGAGTSTELPKALLQTCSATQNLCAPGSVPLWGAGGPEGNDTDCTRSLHRLRRPFLWLVNKHGVHALANGQSGLTERDESTDYPVFMHL